MTGTSALRSTSRTAACDATAGSSLRVVAVALLLAALLRAASCSFSCPAGCVCEAESAASADCSGLGLAAVPRDGFDVDTRRIVLADNAVAALEDSALFDTGVRRLRELVLARNRVAHIADDAFLGQWQLELVDLSHNALAAFSLRPFRRTPRLSTLLLSHNPLHTVDGSGGPTALASLSLSNCRLHHVLEEGPVVEGVAHLPATLLERLHTLELDGNPLGCDCVQLPTYRRLESLGLARDTHCGDPPAIYWQSKLELIDCTPCPRGCTCQTPNVANCSGAGLQSVPQSEISESITTFVLSNNAIKRIDKGTFELFNATTVEVLMLDRNAIWLLDEGAFEGLPRLRRLDLSHNTLVGLPEGSLEAAGLSSLEELVLAQNNISHVAGGAFMGLERLRRLDLSHNLLLTLPQGFPAGASSLVELSLAGNRLQNISWLAAGTSLRNLDVADNLVKTLSVRDVAPLQGFTSFSLLGNPLNCNSRLSGAFHVLEGHGLARDSRCHDPLELRGRYWQVLDRSPSPMTIPLAGLSLSSNVKGQDSKCSSKQQVSASISQTVIIVVLAIVSCLLLLTAVLLAVILWRRCQRQPETRKAGTADGGFVLLNNTNVRSLHDIS